MKRPKNVEVREGMCRRLIDVIDKELRLTDAQAAQVMGYEGSAQLRAVRKGTSFPDVERLGRLWEHARGLGFNLDLQWVLTGVRAAGACATDSRLFDLAASLPPKRRSALLVVAEALAQ
jgi:hypothetical protein